MLNNYNISRSTYATTRKSFIFFSVVGRTRNSTDQYAQRLLEHPRDFLAPTDGTERGSHTTPAPPMIENWGRIIEMSYDIVYISTTCYFTTTGALELKFINVNLFKKWIRGWKLKSRRVYYCDCYKIHSHKLRFEK